MTEQDDSDALTSLIPTEITDLGFQKVQEFVARLQLETTHTIWFQNTLISLLAAVFREYQSLKVGLKESVPLLAWACRNMLELNIFTKYVLLKGSFAKDFTDDMWIDAIDVFSSLRAYVKVYEPSSATTELDQTIRNCEIEKTKQGITRKGYLRVNDMADAVSFSQEYQFMNKVTSKLVHPTAFSVLCKSDEGELGNLKPIFFHTGVRYGLEALDKIQEYVAKNGVEPLTLT